MATTRKAGRRKAAGSKPAPRARRVVVAKAKSSSRAKTSAKAGASRRATPAAPRRTKTKAGTPRSSKLAAVPPARQPAAKREMSRPAGRVEVGTPPPVGAAQEAALTDEERIESAKYLPRRTPARVFEEERFIFPQTYGVNRLRLLVKDPEWMFAYWDVDPASLASLRADLGERASALSQLTLRVFEARGGGASTFLLPQDARTWYVPTRSAGRAYRAEVGVILPSGEFRPLAQSNSVVTPRGGRSAQKAKRTVRYDRARPMSPAATLGPSDEDASAAEGPWSPPLDAGAGPEEQRPRPEPRRGGKPGDRGGASDLHRR